jgi:hypothetical protein
MEFQASATVCRKELRCFMDTEMDGSLNGKNYVHGS